jgi:hypothetical protein
MKKVIRLTESDLINIVKRVINESDEKSTFELKIETTPDDQLGPVIENFFATKTEAEIKEYFMELNNRKPKWLKKLLKHFVNPKNKDKKIKKAAGAITFYSILFMIKQIFGIKLKELLGLPSNPVNEHKRPHYGDNKTIQSTPIQNFINLGKVPGLSKTPSGDAYIGKSGNFSYTFKAKGTNGNGTYYVNNKPGQWRFDDGTACASNLPNCKIFKGVKLVTPVSSK